MGLDYNHGKRPDGSSIIPWKMGNFLVWDFSCSDTYAPSYIKQTTERDGTAAELPAHKNHLKYPNIKSRGMHFGKIK